MAGRLYKYTRLLIFPLLILLLVIHVPLAEASSPWQQVGEGIEYRQFRLPDPNNVFVARMDRHNLNVTIESSISQGTLSGGFEEVTEMADRYDQAINYWGQSWGSRNKVVVAINGSFYNTKTGVPVGGVIHSGWYAKRFDNLGGGSGFAWKLDRSAFIGRCVTHNPDEQYVFHPASGTKSRIDGINIKRPANTMIMYTPQFDDNTGTYPDGAEVLIEMTRPTLILPEPSFARGYVREIRPNHGSSFIPFDHIVLSAHGTATSAFTNYNVGDEVRISQEITHLMENCSTPYSPDWTKTYASIGGSYNFLIDGVIKHFSEAGATERHPRTAIAFNDDYIFFIVVDGRDPGVSIGMTIDELAIFTRDTLGATWGIAQDGGGSSTMVVNGAVMNHPNPHIPTYEIFLPMVTGGSGQPEATKNAPAPSVFIEDPEEEFGIQRHVANGMMMIVVEDKVQSTTFYTASSVRIVGPTEVHLGPGTNYPSPFTLPTGSIGIILEHNSLNGVLAKDSYWWKVSFDGITGWVPEEALVLVSGPGD